MYDIDYSVGIETITDDLDLPCPTFLIQNPKNYHAHALYALNTAVHCNDNSSIKALRFAGAVDVAMTTALKADAGFAGLITKNPLHESWRTYSFDAQYDLIDFTDFVDLKKYSDKRKRVEAVGLGRNCCLFDMVIMWAIETSSTIIQPVVFIIAP
jgi:hypothetical protein